MKESSIDFKRCESNEVHTDHGLCNGVSPDGTGLTIVDGWPTPWPKKQDKFLPGVLDKYRAKFNRAMRENDIQMTHALRIPPPWVQSGVALPPVENSDPTVLGFSGDNGESLLEFRIRNGKVEARYYESDLNEAARRFVEFMVSNQAGEEAPL